MTEKAPERIWITHYEDGGVSSHWLDAPRKYDPERDPVKIVSVEYIRADIARASSSAGLPAVVCRHCGLPVTDGHKRGWYHVDSNVAVCATTLGMAEPIEVSSAGEDAQVDEVSAALAELREMFPGCSFELVSRYNAGFYKTPERYFDIGVISPDYHFNERIDSAGSLADAMQKVRERKEQQ